MPRFAAAAALLATACLAPTVQAQIDLPGYTQPAVSQIASPADFTTQGEADFKAGKYSTAVRDWRHALVDDPQNGAVVMLLSQALLQTGQYDEAAGAAQAALHMLPQDKWGAVIGNYKELYGKIQDYTDQIKALEKARDAKPDDPALHFLLGYHFGFLGYPKHAVKELDKTIELAPKDEMAVKLRDLFKGRLATDANAQPKPPAPVDADANPPETKPAEK